MLKITRFSLNSKETGCIGQVVYNDGNVYEIWQTPSGRFDLYSEQAINHLDLYEKKVLLYLCLSVTY